MKIPILFLLAIATLVSVGILLRSHPEVKPTLATECGYGTTPLLRFSLEPSDLSALAPGERIAVRFQKGDSPPFAETVAKLLANVHLVNWPALQPVQFDGVLEENSASGHAAIVVRPRQALARGKYAVVLSLFPELAPPPAERTTLLPDGRWAARFTVGASAAVSSITTCRKRDGGVSVIARFAEKVSVVSATASLGVVGGASPSVCELAPMVGIDFTREIAFRCADSHPPLVLKVGEGLTTQSGIHRSSNTQYSLAPGGGADDPCAVIKMEDEL